MQRFSIERRRKKNKKSLANHIDYHIDNLPHNNIRKKMTAPARLMKRNMSKAFSMEKVSS